MIDKDFTTLQMETVYTLLLNKRTEPQIVQATGYSVSLVRHILQANRARFASRFSQRHKRWQRHSHHQMKHTDYANALRAALGKEPLYGDHTQHKIEQAKLKQASVLQGKMRARQEPSILESLVGDEFFSGR